MGLGLQLGIGLVGKELVDMNRVMVMVQGWTDWSGLIGTGVYGT